MPDLTGKHNQPVPLLRRHARFSIRVNHYPVSFAKVVEQALQGSFYVEAADPSAFLGVAGRFPGYIEGVLS